MQAPVRAKPNIGKLVSGRQRTERSGVRGQAAGTGRQNGRQRTERSGVRGQAAGTGRQNGRQRPEPGGRAVTVDPLVLIAEVDRATARLLETAQTPDDAEVGEPSPLPRGSRGHVLTHVARNADGCTNLLTWARTGVETPQYASAESREADIAAGAGRPLADQLTDLKASAARFAEAAAEMPPEAWLATVRWLSGRTELATGVVWTRPTRRAGCSS